MPFGVVSWVGRIRWGGYLIGMLYKLEHELITGTLSHLEPNMKNQKQLFHFVSIAFDCDTDCKTIRLDLEGNVSFIYN